MQQFRCYHRIKCEAVDYERFQDVTDTWIRRPQVVNRKLAGAVIVKQLYIPSARANEAASIILASDDEEISNNGDNVCCIVRKLLPRAQHVPSVSEVIIKDDKKFSLTFLPLEHGGGLLPYSLQFYPQTSELVLGWCNCVQRPCCHESKDSSDISGPIFQPDTCNSDHILEPTCGINIITLPWLIHVLLPKLVTWAQSWDETRTKRDSLISLEHYIQLYQVMKKRYAGPLMEMWTEVTDPLKYIYEDIAIATYLIVLWEQERESEGLKKKQSFIDLGCGNGLLVYLLTMEGYPGVGIDVRRRKIWEKYGPGVRLKEEVVVPSEASLYPNFDWIIGNHSDELTPWLPLMAARSSYSTRYFSIPCCFHDFDRKFCRSHPTLSQYESYLQYTKTIGEEMGFVVCEDQLRIPSSKKICQIGMKRTYHPAEEAAVDKKRKEFLQARCHQVPSTDGTHSPGDEQWAKKFSPRCSVEPVKNCTLVKKDIQKEIVQKLTCVLLQTQNIVQSENGEPWNVGGRIPLKEAAKLINSELLTKLKQEHGGLQTLFRNHHQVFVARDGFVQLRDWSKREDDTTCGNSVNRRRYKPSERQLLYKTMLCWFHTHHPQGCPRSRIECCYAHGVEDLATRPQFLQAKPKK